MGFPLLPGIPALAGAAGLGSAIAGTALETSYHRWRNQERAQSFQSGKKSNAAAAKMQQRRKRPRFRRRKRLRLIRRRRVRALQPRSKLVRVKVSYPKVLTLTAGALNAFATKIMDLTDPRDGDGNEQFLGYDQWKTLYNKAVVVGLKATALIHNTTSKGIMCGITPFPENQSYTTLASIGHYMETPGTVSRLLSPEVDHTVLSRKLGTARHFGVRKLMDEDAFHCKLPSETAPTRDAYVSFWAAEIDPVAGDVKVEFVVTLEFLVRLFDPIIPSRSTDT